MINFFLTLPLLFAYIPHSHFILEKTAESHGKGSYVVQQEVVFQNSKERLVIQETWTVEDGVKMHLEAKGPGIHFSAKYDYKYRYFMNDKNNMVKQQLGSEFFENIFYLQEARDLARRIYNANILGKEILSPQRRFYNLSQIEYKGQDFIRLSRQDGKIAYAFGEVSESNTPPLPAGLWIHQDDFQVIKIRFPSQVSVVASEYDVYSNKLQLPKERMIEWGQNKTPIRLIRVSSVRLKGDSKLKTSLNKVSGLSQITFGQSSLTSAVEEFYKRFR